MSDDISNLPLPKSAKKYARLTSKDLGNDWSKKPKLFIKAAGDLSHQSTSGFPHSSGGHSLGKAVKGAKKGFPNIAGTTDVPHAMKEARASRIVNKLLDPHADLLQQMTDVAVEPMERLRQAMEAYRSYGNEEGRLAALLTFLGIDPNTPVEGYNPGDNLVNVLLLYMNDATDDGWALEQLKMVIRKVAPNLDQTTTWVLNKALEEVAKEWQEAREAFDREMADEIHGRWGRDESVMKSYRYYTCCVDCPGPTAGEDINDMTDTAQDISYQQFFRAVPLSEVFRSGVAYGYYWTPAQCVAAGVPYEEVRNNGPLTMKKDWHISYHKGVFRGVPCYFFIHSAIEYIFVQSNPHQGERPAADGGDLGY